MIMKTKRRVICIFAVICVLSTVSAVAQEKAYIPFNQIRFSATAAMYDNLKVVDNSGIGGAFQSKPCFGGDITVSYYQNIIKWFGMSLGVGISSAPYNTTFNFIPNTEGLPENSMYANGINHSDYNPQGMLIIPLSVSMLIPTKNNSWLCNVELGAKCNIALSESDGMTYYGDVNNNSESINNDIIKEQSLAWIQYSTKQNVMFSYFFKVGFSKLMKRNNSWNLNIVANYSPQKLGIGSYGLKSINGNINGSFEQNINFIGIEVGYGLTLSKKKGEHKDAM